jgi:uncharacterized protein YpiB (UPF0302 family)
VNNTPFFDDYFRGKPMPRIGDAVHLDLQRHVREKAEEERRATDERLRERVEEARQEKAQDALYDETPYRRAFREYQRKLDDAVLRNIYSALSDDEQVAFYDLDNPLIAASEQDGVFKITTL